jgi:hypothetical protein
VKELGERGQHGQVDETGEGESDHYVEALEAQHPAALGVIAGRHPALGQGRVQIDDVGHDRGADDADGEIELARAAEIRN